jgi:hypothetical protein
MGEGSVGIFTRGLRGVSRLREKGLGDRGSVRSWPVVTDGLRCGLKEPTQRLAKSRAREGV